MSATQPRIIVLGAGMAGILAGIRLQAEGYSDITLYEKADRVGGTWRDNTYPGLTCDVPSHFYTYSFERNPDWSRHLPPRPEIQAYFERTAAKYGVDTLNPGRLLGRPAQGLPGGDHAGLSEPVHAQRPQRPSGQFLADRHRRAPVGLHSPADGAPACRGLHRGSTQPPSHE